MLTAVANESNTYEIDNMNKLLLFSLECSDMAVGKIALQQYDVNAIVDRLLQFLEMEKDYVTAEALPFLTLFFNIANGPYFFPFPASDDYHYQSLPQTQNKLQSLVDLVMWRDVSKSALIFGIGTFITISSSYTQDLNISFITVISYVGLVYLAAIFLYRSIISRGIVDIDESRCAVGEEEAIIPLSLI
ncbi:hypothetical protein V6N11_007706 [Hibiscus sabdariffa]|uniref:Reticulon domain-containing protein n=2 Tax=Hibiscus sabdariffa TaxID=183260 RepID=A0ABR2NJN6_9ROSI